LESLTLVHEGFNLVVGESLDLGSLKSTPKEFNPTVGKNLNLCDVVLIHEGFNPIIGKDLYLESLKSIPKGFNPIVGGNIDLGCTTSIPENFSLIVGGDIWLDSLISIPKNFNPTIGGNLDLRGVTSIPEDFNPIIKGGLWLNGSVKTPKNWYEGKCQYQDVSSLLSWKDGKYVRVDGIFTEVLHTRGNIRKAKKLDSDKEFYLVTDGNGNYAHGNTIREANQDLLFKTTRRNKSDYEELGVDSVLPYVDAIICYRVITGACSFGTKDFLNNRLKNKQKQYSIKEIIELTKNEYKGEEFKEFFTKSL